MQPTYKAELGTAGLWFINKYVDGSYVMPIARTESETWAKRIAMALSQMEMEG
jgi:hypothetical protein